jgi:hypothetical protein
MIAVAASCSVNKTEGASSARKMVAGVLFARTTVNGTWIKRVKERIILS